MPVLGSVSCGPRLISFLLAVHVAGARSAFERYLPTTHVGAPGHLRTAHDRLIYTSHYRSSSDRQKARGVRGDLAHDEFTGRSVRAFDDSRIVSVKLRDCKGPAGALVHG